METLRSAKIEAPQPRPGEGGPQGSTTPTTTAAAATVAGGGDAADGRNIRRGRTTFVARTEPSGALTGVLGELAFYYGACCLYHSAPRRGKTPG